MIPGSSIRVKNARANGADVLRARTKSQSMLPQRAGELEHAREVGLLLGEREQLRRDHVAERGDEHRLGDHVQLARALEVAVVDRAAGRMEDQVDERLAVPGLDQLTLRGTLRPHPCGDERVERARHVAHPHEEVDIVLGRRPTTCPAGERLPGSGAARFRRAAPA